MSQPISPDSPFRMFVPLEEADYQACVELIAHIRLAEDKRAYAVPLADIIAKLTDHSLEYAFMQPIEMAKLGFIAKNSARLGMMTAKKSVQTLVRKMLKDMSNEQLAVITEHLAGMIEQRPSPPTP